MGVPKFFRWLSERYPKINQRFGSPLNPKTAERYFDRPPLEAAATSGMPDELSCCGLPPEIDRLYLDMNGIIHGCSHVNNSDDDDNNNDDAAADGNRKSSSSAISSREPQSNEEIFRNVCFYLDRIIGDMVHPKEIVYMAVDGVAPRAKMNQQRSRRYRSGTEGAIETTILGAHAKAMAEQREVEEMEGETESQNYEKYMQYFGGVDPMLGTNGTSDKKKNKSTSRSTNKGVDDDFSNKDQIEEIEDGRFKGKVEAQTVDDGTIDEEEFHFNAITPGTPFFQEFTKHLEHFVKYKISTDPKWKHLTIIISGPNVPGEGEHKIMQFIREQKVRQDYNPNLRHCIMGQDGDLIMLGLATHEPNLVLLRERVLFNLTKHKLAFTSVDSYTCNGHFEFLHMGILRDYLAYEFETSNVLSSEPWDIERTVDDFVFMTFFVGNDFLPHMPALDIADNAFDLLFHTYKTCRREWLEEHKSNPSDMSEPYLTNAGSIVSGRRLEEFLTAVGSHEVEYYKRKKNTTDKSKDDGDHELAASKEESDRAAYRKMLHDRYGTSSSRNNSDNNGIESTTFTPVVSNEITFVPNDEEPEEDLVSRMGTLLRNTLSGNYEKNDGNSATNEPSSDDMIRMDGIDDQDLKGRYYYDKFKFTPFDTERHIALRKAYMEGLIWNLKYYYQGCISWEWYYPYHYGPMLSDLVDLDVILNDISFDGKLGKPLRPFEQLLGCMPPSMAHNLPQPYQWLMTDPSSPIADFYPKSFTVDMNGKRWPWEAVVLLPFIDSTRLLDAVRKNIDETKLTEEERQRNSFGDTYVWRYDANTSESIPSLGDDVKCFKEIKENKAIKIPFDETDLKHTSDVIPVLEPTLEEGIEIPLPGFATLRNAPVQSLVRRRLGINVFGTGSRYKTANLEMAVSMPPLPPIQDLAPKLIGTTIFVNYPYFLEGYVTAISDGRLSIRGRDNPPVQLTATESKAWEDRKNSVVNSFLYGEGYTGTGGVMLQDNQSMTLSVRPLQGLVQFGEQDTAFAKKYAEFEIEVPLATSFWHPTKHDPRLVGVPSILEKNAFEIAMPELSSLPTMRNGPNYHSRKSSSSFSSNSSRRHNRGKNGNTESSGRFGNGDGSGSSSRRGGGGGRGSRRGGGGGGGGGSGDGSSSSFQSRKKRNSNKNISANKLNDIDGTDRAGLEQRNYHTSSCSSDYSSTSSSFSSFLSLKDPLNTAGPVPFGQNIRTEKTKLFHGNDFWKNGNKRSYYSSSTATITRSNATTARPLPPLAASATTRKTPSVGTGKSRMIATGVVLVASLFFQSANGAKILPSTIQATTRTRTTTSKSPMFRSHHVSPFGSEESDKNMNLSLLLGRLLDLRAGGTSRNRLVDGTARYDGDETNENTNVPPLEFAHGTTTLSFVYQGGIVAAVDSRASLGNFVGSKTTQKVLPVNSHILGTMAGGAADCMFWIRKLKTYALLHELTNNGRRMSVARASRLLSNFLYQNRGLDLSVGTMIMGYDDDGSNNGGAAVVGGGKGNTNDDSSSSSPPPRIYYVDNTGVRIEGDLFAVGSGGTFALGILDTERRYDMTDDEAIALGIKAIRHATFRDAHSGGYINVYHITKHGWKKVFTEDLARSPESFASSSSTSDTTTV